MAFLRSIPPENFADSLPLSPDAVEIDVLLGADYVWDILSCPADRFVLPSGLFLLASKLGLLLTGSCRMPVGVQTHNLSLSVEQPVISTNLCGNIVSSHTMEDFWQLDAIGISNLSPAQTDDDAAAVHFSRTLQYNPEQQRYAVAFPWKDHADALPTIANFDLAYARMKSLSKRFA